MNHTVELTETEKRQYPTGKLKIQNEYTIEEIQKMINAIERFPAKLRETLKGIKKEQLDTPYREGGWTVRQVVHHLFDSHANAYMRCKLALTENNPTIKPYDEKKWAELEDSKLPSSVSVSLLINLHKRWTALLKSMQEEDFNRTFFHPENNAEITLAKLLNIYSWHGDHHLAHINLVLKKKKSKYIA